MSKVVDLTKHRLSKNPVCYSVDIAHTAKGLEFRVRDIQSDPRSLLAVANDLEEIATHIRREFESPDASTSD
jgi:hypothetical protein